MAALLVGVFAVSPMVFLGAKQAVVERAAAASIKTGFRQSLREGAGDLWRYRYGTLRGSVLGVLLGIIPAVGGATASFVSYVTSKQHSRNGEEYGTGNPEGLIASETANDAKDGGALMPTLAFGIPGDPNTAVLLGALLMHGVALGRPPFNNDLPMVMVIVLALVLGQVVVAGLGLVISPFVTRITTVASYFLVPVVVTCALVGSYLFRHNVWDTTIVVVAAVGAYWFSQFNYPVISLVLGFLLGVEAERAFIQTMLMSRGNYAGLFEGAIVWTIITIMVASFVGAWLINTRSRARIADTSPIWRGQCELDAGGSTACRVSTRSRRASQTTSQRVNTVGSLIA